MINPLPSFPCGPGSGRPGGRRCPCTSTSRAWIMEAGKDRGREDHESRLNRMWRDIYGYYLKSNQDSELLVSVSISKLQSKKYF